MGEKSSLYIGNLPRDVDVDEINELCCRFTVPLHVEKPIDRCSVVQFENGKVAWDVWCRINGRRFWNDTVLSVGFLFRKSVLYVTGFDEKLPRENLESALSRISKVHVEFMRDYAEVQFRRERDFNMFLQRVTMKSFTVDGRLLQWSYYPSPSRPTLEWLQKHGLDIPDGILFDQRRILISNLPPNYTENDLVKLLTPFGSWSAITGMHNIEGMLHAVVTYIETKNACEAIRKLFNRNVEGYVLSLSWLKK